VGPGCSPSQSRRLSLTKTGSFTSRRQSLGASLSLPLVLLGTAALDGASSFQQGFAAGAAGRVGGIGSPNDQNHANSVVPTAVDTLTDFPLSGRRGMSRRGGSAPNLSTSSKSRARMLSLNLMVADPSTMDSVLTAATDPTSLSGILSSSLIMAGGSLASAASAIHRSPGMETEMMTRLSHLVDLSSLFQPESMALKSMTFMQRMVDMSSDVDHRQDVSPDELIYQGGMLAASIKQVVTSLQKMAGGAVANIKKESSFRDRVAFHGLFSQAGVTRGEFQSLISSDVMDWVDVKPHEKIETSPRGDGAKESVYWLYSGEATLKNASGSSSTNLTMARRRGKDASFKQRSCSRRTFEAGLLADSRSLSSLMGLPTPSANEDHDAAGSSSSAKLMAGPSGATVLQINVSKMRKRMENDDALDRKLRNLVFLSLRSKADEVDMAVINTMQRS
jgi:hypothetical protein